MRKKCGCKKKKLGPQRQRRGKAGKVLNRMETALKKATQVEPPRVVRNSNKKPRRVRRRY
jgi:hypothetical protein